MLTLSEAKVLLTSPQFTTRQYRMQRKAPVFKLLRGRFWGFFAPQGWHVAPTGVKFGMEEASVPSFMPNFTPIGGDTIEI